MLNPEQIQKKAQTSAFYRGILNWSLGRLIPFNRPHRIRVLDVSPNHLRTSLPYVRRNMNHIRGLHACALATVSEFTTGFLLVSRLDGSKYRLIMQRIEMDYHYQGKMDATAEFSAPDDWMRTNVYEPLQTQPAIVVVCEVKTYDTAGNHLTTGKVHWQIKAWDKVRTRA